MLVARSIDFGDPAAVHEAVELTHHFLNLGLENLAAGDLRSAIEHLRDTHLKLLFRLGVSLTIDLRKPAQSSKRQSLAGAEKGSEFQHGLKLIARNGRKFWIRYGYRIASSTVASGKYILRLRDEQAATRSDRSSGEPVARRYFAD